MTKLKYLQANADAKTISEILNEDGALILEDVIDQKLASNLL